jgi:hypothetical protein
LPTLYAMAVSAPPAASGQRRFINDYDGFAALLDSHDMLRHANDSKTTARLGISPQPEGGHAGFNRVLQLIDADGLAHIHAEQVKEVEDCLQWRGVRSNCCLTSV